MAFIGTIFLGTAVVLLQSPIFFELLRRTITKGIVNGAFLALGGFIAYFSLLTIVFFGTYEILLLESVKFILFLVGGIVLMSIGIGAIKMKYDDVYTPKRPKKELKIFKKQNHPIFAGFSIAISSPLDVAVWVSIAITHLGRYDSKLVGFINVVFFALGVLAVFLGLASLMYLTRKRIKITHILGVSKVFGFILVGYGLYFLFQFLKILLA